MYNQKTQEIVPIVIGAFAGLVAGALDGILNKENDKSTSAVIVFVITILAVLVISLIGGEE